jgi:hypothetical protein
LTEAIGWVATGVFAVSYFVRGRRTMLAVQMGAAVLWMAYGLLTAAAPVIVANAIVVTAAAASMWRRGRTPG